jgi:hypothetical protein
MTKKADEFQELRDKIARYISIGKENLSFEFQKKRNAVCLRLLTYNPMHEQHFLFHEVSSDSEGEALREMLKYVRYHKEEESSYTIQWSLIGEHKLHTSYFRAEDVLGALNKFYYNRDPNGVVVFSVILNPIS